MNDEIYTRTTVVFSFLDRIRILLGRKVTVCVDVKTENRVGETETESSVSVDKIMRGQNKSSFGAYIEVQDITNQH